MYTINKLLILAILLFLLCACEHTVTMETTVHPDGKLDKQMVFEQGDTTQNFMNLSPENGWKKITQAKTNPEDSATTKLKNKEYIVTYQKSFESAEAANKELATPSDTLFRVTSTFTKKFRWFYTYIYYADTYQALNRMKLPITDYVTNEDYQFIDRLPAEGKAISKADSLQLTLLNSKLFDSYGMRAIYEEHFEQLKQILEQQQLASNWQDSLSKHKETIFNKLTKGKGQNDDYLLTVIDSLNIPIDYQKASTVYAIRTAELDKKTNFISDANEGKYTHLINMPWRIVRTNADSVAGNQARWNPPTVKFLLKDYTMYAEARQLNYWAFMLTIVLIGATVYLFARKNK